MGRRLESSAVSNFGWRKHQLAVWPVSQWLRLPNALARTPWQAGVRTRRVSRHGSGSIGRGPAD